MKIMHGIFVGILFTLGGVVAYSLLFPKSKEEMCHSIRKISKDMEKDLENMM